MREYVQTSEFQSGSQNFPGTFVNTTIINGVLNKTKEESRDATIVFLDIAKAFDSVGHAHIFNTLDSLHIPISLRNVLKTLTINNFTRIRNKADTSNPIQFLRGIFQGSVISPEIFNHCVDFILKSLSEKEITMQYGFNVIPDLNPLTCLEFVDDNALIGRNNDAAAELVGISIEMYKQIGLEVNINKTQAICIKEKLMKIRLAYHRPKFSLSSKLIGLNTLGSTLITNSFSMPRSY